IMFLTIVAVLCAIIGLIVMAAGKAMKPENKNRSSTRFTGISIFIVSLIVLAIACTTIVQPRTVGVKVALGKPTSVVSNGFHLKWPWEKVEKLDGSVQNDVYTGDSAIPV